MGGVRIGTSGWHYKHWRGPFYPERFAASKMLDFYLQRFDTVEINNSFYRLPTENAVKLWANSTPDDFQFAVKGSRFLTHMKKLREPDEGIRRFFDVIDLLGPKLGPVLFQLPPQWPVNAERLDAFLEALPRWHRYTFEFRNETWNTEEVLGVLRRHNAGYCIYDLAGYQSPVFVTSDLVYIRLHGPGGKYQGSYDDGKLTGLAGYIREQVSGGNDVYVYFDNDDSGYAAHNALTLQRLTGQGNRCRA